MFRILVNDSKSQGYDLNYSFFLERHKWAGENCQSYDGYEVTDVSDVSLQWDEVAEYRFKDEREANWFKLRWL